MKLPGYLEVYVRLNNEGHEGAKALTDLILKYGVKEVTPVETDGVKGEYVVCHQRGLSVPPVYFVGVHLDTGKEVVEVVA